MFESAHATLDELVTRTLAELAHHKARGGTEHTYQTHLVQQFVAAADNLRPTAGAIHMALCLYRLALAHRRLEQCAAENARYAATLRDLDALEGL